MAYARGFDYDIFISYARLDNQPLGEEKGWVDKFETDLKSVLNQECGKDVIAIFRDIQQTPDTRFDKNIPEKMKKSALFLALVSPNFLESEWCMNETDDFFSCMEQSIYGTETGEHKSRLLTLLLSDLPHDRWPEVLQNTNPFRFYTGEKEESYSLFWKDPAYYHEIQKLKKAIKASLDAHNLAVENQTAGRTQQAGGFTLFLADVSEKLQFERKQLNKTLAQTGINLLEKIPPPYDYTGHSSKLNEIIPKVHLSVHLLGDVPGREFDDREDSYYPISQVEIIRDKKIPQLILLPESLESTAGIRRDPYKTWIENLKTCCLKADKTWLTYFTSNNLCTLVSQKIEELNKQDDEGLYLIRTNKQDQACAHKLACWLLEDKKQGAEIIPTRMESEEADLLMKKEYAGTVRTIIVLYGNSSITWVRANLEQYKKWIIARKQGNHGKQLWLYLLPPLKESLPVDFTAFLTENSIRILDNSKSDDIDPSVAQSLVAQPGKEEK